MSLEFRKILSPDNSENSGGDLKNHNENQGIEPSFPEVILSDIEKKELLDWIYNESSQSRYLERAENIFKKEGVTAYQIIKNFRGSNEDLGNKIIEVLDKNRKVILLKQLFIDKIKSYYFSADKILKMCDDKNLILSDPNVIASIKDYIKSCTESKNEMGGYELANTKYAISLLSDISDEEKSILQEKILAKEIIDRGKYGIDLSFLFDKYFILSEQQKYKILENVLVGYLNKESLHNLDFVDKAIKISPQIISATVTKEYIEKSLISSLEKLSPSYSSSGEFEVIKSEIDFIKKHEIPIDISQILSQSAVSHLTKGDSIEFINLYDEKFDFKILNNEKGQEAAIAGIANYIRGAHNLWYEVETYISNINKKVHIPAEKLRTQNMLVALQERIANIFLWTDSGNPQSRVNEELEEIKNAFGFSPIEIVSIGLLAEVAKKDFLGHKRFFLSIIDTYPAITGIMKSDKDFTYSVVSFVEEKINQGDFESINKYVTCVPSPELLLKTYIPNLRESLKSALTEGNLELINKLSEASSIFVDDKFETSNELQDVIINSLRNIYGEKNFHTISEQFPKFFHGNNNFISTKSAVFLIENKETLNFVAEHMDVYPFLVDAFQNNERFASKLILKFPELDNVSKENIQLLYKLKQTILKNNPAIDEDSSEYRTQVQDGLLSYKNNKIIINSIEQSGVHAQNWLDYDQEQYFQLGVGQELTFAETVKTPVERIGETLGLYKDSLKRVFSEYQKELQAFRIPLESVDDIQKEIDIMTAKIIAAEQSGDQEQIKKANGMRKGLINLEARKENPKTAPIWQKITGDFDAIVRVGQDVEKSHKLLSDLEKEYREGLKKESHTKEDRDQLFTQKKKMDLYLKDFQEKLNLLEMRMKLFNEQVQTIVSPCLGIDRTTALCQELNGSTFEALDHFKSDITSSKIALKNLFDENKQSNLDGHFLKIAVWGRNPDRDLYLGNYTDCCIRIDSEHMGGESTIADYLTDLGIQVITVLDETTNEPIAAVWTYIGEDNKKPKMVIDNIEANRSYAPYFDTIKNNLKKYMEQYAVAVGISEKDISQGKNNNDIVLNVKYGDFYNKLGGYNRAGGYYLEAEPDEDNENEDNDEENENDDEDEENENEEEQYNEYINTDSSAPLVEHLNQSSLEALERARRNLSS